MTRLSIFNFELLWRVRTSPPQRRAWALGLIAGATCVVVWGSVFLNQLLIDPDRKAPSPEILFVGTSHQMAAVDRERLPLPTHRLDLAGLDLFVAGRSFEKHQRDYRQLRVALIEFDEFTLFGDTVAARIDDLSGVCGPLDLAAWELVAPCDDLLRRYRIFANLWYGRGNASLSESKRLTTEGLLRRLLPPAKTVRRSKLGARAGEARVAYAQRKLFFAREQQNLTGRNLPALIRMIGSLRRQGTRVCLVRYPESKAYRAARPQAWEHHIEEALGTLTSLYPDLEFYDYATDPRFTADDFADVDHLNPLGAVLMTRLLCDDILSH